MRHATLTALTPALLASPLMAHSGSHIHLHSAEVGVLGLAGLLVISAAVFVMKVRK